MKSANTGSVWPEFESCLKVRSGLLDVDINNNLHGPRIVNQDADNLDNIWVSSSHHDSTARAQPLYQKRPIHAIIYDLWMHHFVDASSCTFIKYPGEPLLSQVQQRFTFIQWISYVTLKCISLTVHGRFCIKASNSFDFEILFTKVQMYRRWVKSCSAETR